MLSQISEKTLDMLMHIDYKNPNKDLSDIFISLFKNVSEVNEEKVYNIVKKCYLNGCKL